MKKTNLILLLFLMIFTIVGCNNDQPVNNEQYFLTAENETIDMYVNDTYQIEIDTDIPYELTWESYEPDIAKVDNNGLVTALKKGFTIVCCYYEQYQLEIMINITYKPQVMKSHKITIDGFGDIEVKEGIDFSEVLKLYFGEKMHYNYDDQVFKGWFTNETYTKELDLDSQVYNDLTIYPKYDAEIKNATLSIAINNNLFYESKISEESIVQVFTSDYGKTIAYEDETYVDYLVITTEYDYNKNITTIKSKQENNNKENTIIPYNGYVIIIPKFHEKYLYYYENIQIGDTISLDTYSINTANKIYINEIKKESSSIESITLDLNAEFASVYDYTNNKTLYQKQADDKAYPASTTKIICALAALQNAPVDLEITVGDELDVTYEGSTPSTAGIKKGQVWTLRQLLYALMLPSGNDAAYVIAAGVARNIEGNENLTVREQLLYFNNLMNDIALEVDAKNTHFMVPDGNSYYNSDGSWEERLSNHYVTANDMIKFAKLALNYSMLAKVVSSYYKKIVLKDNTTYAFYNTNSLINPTKINYYNQYAIGIKTGTTTPGGCCLIVAFEKDGQIIIASILKSSSSANRNQDAAKVFNAIYQNN